MKEFRRQYMAPESQEGYEPGETDVDGLVAEEHRLEEQRHKYILEMDIPRVVKALFECPDARVDQGFHSLIERIDHETDVVKEMADTITKDNLLSGLASWIYPTQVEFGKDIELNPEASVRLKKRGQYFPETATIRIAEATPSTKAMWLDMTFGVPQILKTLDHETIHHWFEQGAKKSGWQKIENFKDFLKIKIFDGLYFLGLKTLKTGGYMQRLGNVSPRFEQWAQTCKSAAGRMFYKSVKAKSVVWDRETEKRLLSEVAAQKAGRVFEKASNATIALLDTLRDYYGYKDPSDIDKVIAASQLIDRLGVLGFGDKEIATKLAQATYDRETASFPDLEEEIARQAEKKGMDLEDLDTEVDILRLKKRIQVARATVIAQEELERLVNEETPAL